MDRDSTLSNAIASALGAMLLKLLGALAILFLLAMSS